MIGILRLSPIRGTILGTTGGTTISQDGFISNPSIAERVASELDTDVDTLLTTISNIDLIVRIIEKLTGNKVTKVGDVITIFEADEVTPWRQYNLANGGRVQV